MYNTLQENEQTKKEIEIRGRIIMMACDIEFCLLNIIMYCNPDPNNHERAGKFKQMMMAKKIEYVIEDMQKYKPQIYQNYKKWFDGLDDFRKIRNDMSHSIGIFPNAPDLGIFRITFVDKDENGIEGMKYRDYPEFLITNKYTEFQEINAALSKVWLGLKLEYDGKGNPFVHPSKFEQ